MDITSPHFWSALGTIALANIVLSGDNAVVIAMAARSLKPEQQGKAIFWGSAAAIVMRVILTIVAIKLLALPYLKIIGSLLLIYIGVDLLSSSDADEEGHIQTVNGMGAAIRTILIADLVMSLDNVLAVAAAAKGDVALLTIGLLVSIPLIIFGSTLLMKVMQRFPIIITLGAALLGWLAGEMVVTDPSIAPELLAHTSAGAATALHYGASLLCAMIVLLLGYYKRRHAPIFQSDSDQVSDN